MNLMIKFKFSRELWFDYPMLQFFTWATISCFSPYVVLILTDRGLDNTQIGLVLTLNALVSVLAQPFWGLVSDRIRSIKKVFIICLVISAGALLSIPSARTLPHLVLAYPLIIFFLSPITPLLDVWTYQGVKMRSAGSYARLRLWGSLGFAMILLPVGRLVHYFGLNVTIWAYAILGGVSIAISLRLPQATADDSLNVLHARKNLPVSLLLRQYAYTSFVLIMGLMFVAIMPMYGFLARLMIDVGGTPEMYTWAMAIAALSEIPVFLGARKLGSRFSPVALMLVSFAFMTARMYAYSWITQPWQIMAIALVHGLSFALFLVGMVSYIDSLAPAGLKSTAQTILSAVYTGISGMAGNSLAGRLMDQLQIRPVYRLGAYWTAAVTILFILSLLPVRAIRRRQQAVSEAACLNQVQPPIQQ